MSLPVGEESPDAAEIGPNRPKVSALSRHEATELSRQVANLAQSGLPLPSGLRALAEEVPSPGLQHVLRQVADDLQAGESLDEALRSQGPRFPAPLRGLIAAGTRSGHLAESLGRFLDVHDLGDSLRRQLRFSLIYPTLLILVASGMFVFVSVTSANSFENLFRDFGVDLPAITVQLLIASSAVVGIGWWMLIAPILAIVVLWGSMRILLGEGERYRVIHSLPLIGPLARFTAIAEFCPILALLLESDVPLPEALRLTADSCKDQAMGESAREMAEEVESGGSLGDAMKDRRPFPAGFHAFVAWAERNRGLVEALNMSAATFEERAKAQAAFVARFCNTLAMVVVLWWVGITVVALLLPLIYLINVLSGSGVTSPPWPGYEILKIGGIFLGILLALIGLVFIAQRFNRFVKRMGPIFLFGAFLLLLAAISQVLSLVIAYVLEDYIPSWWTDAVSPFIKFAFSCMGGAGILLMVFGTFTTFSGSLQGTTNEGSKRVRVPRIRGLQMSLRHLMFAMVPLSLVFVLAKNFGWSLLSVMAMLSPPLIAVSLLIALTNRKTSRRDALLGVMAMAAREDQPLDPAISAFAESCRGRYRRQLENLASSLRSGVPLGEALKRSPGALSPEGEVIVCVGFETNTLARSLDDAVAAISARRAAHVATAGLIGYPLVVLTAMLGVFAFLVLGFTPQFESIFKDYNFRLPEPTRSIFAMAHEFLQFNLLTIFLMIGFGLLTLGVVLAWLYWSGLIGSIRDRALRRRHTSIVLRALAAAVESEQVLRAVLERLGRSYPRRWVREKLAGVKGRVERGEPLWRSFLEEGLIGKGDAAVLESAAGAGNLPWALREMADSGERRLTYRLHAIGQVLQPVIILALAPWPCSWPSPISSRWSSSSSHFRGRIYEVRSSSTRLPADRASRGRRVAHAGHGLDAAIARLDGRATPFVRAPRPSDAGSGQRDGTPHLAPVGSPHPGKCREIRPAFRRFDGSLARRPAHDRNRRGEGAGRHHEAHSPLVTMARRLGRGGVSGKAGRLGGPSGGAEMTRSRSLPRGVTLVETLAAMTILLIVAGVAAALIESLHVIERGGREHADREAAIARVAHVFRGDVRRFPSAAVDNGLILADADSGRFLLYRIYEDRVARSEWQGLVRISQDSFPLPPRSSPRFERADDEGLRHDLARDRSPRPQAGRRNPPADRPHRGHAWRRSPFREEPSMTPSRTPRRGIALVAVIAVLILLFAVFGLLVRLGLNERKQVRAEERRIAASWLAESGLELAKARLDLDPGYDGGTWRIAPEESGGTDAGLIRIRVETPPDQPSRRTVHVWADTPPDGAHRVRQSRVATIDLKNANPGEKP